MGEKAGERRNVLPAVVLDGLGDETFRSLAGMRQLERAHFWRGCLRAGRSRDEKDRVILVALREPAGTVIEVQRG
jgi:hypothetical protein